MSVISHLIRAKFLYAVLVVSAICAGAALAGSHVATLPSNVLLGMLRHPLTDSGIQQFLADAAKYQPV